MGFEDGPKAICYYDARTRQVQVSRNFRFTDLSANATPANNAPVHTKSVQSEGECLQEKDESNKRKQSDLESVISKPRISP